MTVRAYAKINWALNILGVRDDGYHALDSLISRIDLYDTLSFEPSESLSLTIEGDDDIPRDASNLVIRAAHAMRDYSQCEKGAHIHLVKRIPSQAGLGGGSADAAAALMGLNGFWELGLSLPELHRLAETLGSDVPACLYPGLTRIGGRGELVTPLAGDFPRYHLVLLKPRGGLSTAEVFREYDSNPDTKKADIDALALSLESGNVERIRVSAYNQLQNTAIRLMPEIGYALDDLQSRGAAFALMTGSGSAAFGVFSTEDHSLKAAEDLKGKWPTCLYTTTV